MKNDDFSTGLWMIAFPPSIKKRTRKASFFVPHIYNKKQTAKAVCFSYP